MTLAAILFAGGAGAAIAAWGLSREARIARYATIAGSLALFVVLVLALGMTAPHITEAGIPPNDGWFHGTIVATGYLRLTIALFALDAVQLVGIAWLMGGIPALRGLLPATLAAVAGSTVALGSTDLSLGVAAAGATGLVSLAVLHAMGRTEDVAVGARELRVVLGASVLVFGGVAVAPLAGALALAGGNAGVATGGTPSAGEPGAVLGLVAIAITGGIAARFGAIPFHFRVPRLVDAVPPMALPLLLVWLPLPIGVVGLAALDALVGPLALPLYGEQSLLVAIAIVTMAAAALAAYMADDIRHAIGYLVVADGGLLLVGFAALDPAAWGPTRIWMVALAATKTALAAWGAVTEARFGTRSIADLRGWIRHAPILAAGFALTVAATFGVPGWIVFTARLDLARIINNGQWTIPLTLAALLTLPVYLRILAVGLGRRSSHVEQAASERIPQRRRAPAAIATADGTDAEAAPEVARPTGSPLWILINALRRDRTELISAGVLALAVIATLTAWGALDLGAASAEPAPIVTGPATD